MVGDSGVASGSMTPLHRPRRTNLQTSSRTVFTFFTERERLAQEAVRAAQQARGEPQHDQVDEPIETPEQPPQFMPPRPPQQVNDEEWTWRLEFDVPAPEPVPAQNPTAMCRGWPRKLSSW